MQNFFRNVVQLEPIFQIDHCEFMQELVAELSVERRSEVLY